MDDAMLVEDVSKRFRIYHERNQSLKSAVMRRGRAQFEEFWALRDVDLAIPHGKTFGLVGHNGSGKSTLLKCLARILVPDSGRITSQGRISALLELGAGFHAELSGRDNVYLNGSILGLSRRDIDARFDDIVSFAGLEQFIDSPVKNYSSGMYVRLGFSVAINVEPDILLVDEVLAVGDEEFQRRSLEKFQQFRDDGRTVVVVSHALGTMQTMCDEVAWLDHGRILGVGDPEDIIGRYAGAVGTSEPEAPDGGSCEARVTSVVVSGEHGAATTVSGEATRFRVEWSADEDVRDVEHTLTIRTLDGVTLAVASSGGTGARTLKRGDGAVELVVPRLPLVAGTYVVDATLNRPADGHVVHRADHVAEFVVHPAADSDGSVGLVALGGTWVSTGR
ncbi:ABC transporter ATP-binding protein [Cellulomonas sp. URHD0024]|uniref:ABC transporter ATP-binding protein n=1 Tax=Cellulomonas sp. URHD0024 TaxID=1302620 RepID=UPI000424B564|nr:ABC transporter ATP-binding protein [Cellulomonas sp. URHD0024]